MVSICDLESDFECLTTVMQISYISDFSEEHFPHIPAAIQSRKYLLPDDTIRYIYISSNPLCRVIPIENPQSLPPYDKEKYKEMILDAAETILDITELGYSLLVDKTIRKSIASWQTV